MLALKKRLVAVSLVFGLTLCTGVNSVNAEVRGSLQQNKYCAVDLCKTDTVDDVREALKNQVENITIYLCGDDRNEVADIAKAPFELFGLAAQYCDDTLLFNIKSKGRRQGIEHQQENGDGLKELKDLFLPKKK